MPALPTRRTLLKAVGFAAAARSLSFVPSQAGMLTSGGGREGSSTALAGAGQPAGARAGGVDIPRLEFLPAGSGPASRPLIARVRLIGDMHFGMTGDARLDAVGSDLATLPPPDTFLTTGDETHNGKPEEYTKAHAWLQGWTSPFMTVTGNHTFWNRWNSHQETEGAPYARFLEQWGLPMPYSRDIGGVRFVGAGPTTVGATRSEASLTLDQVDELAAFLALAPSTPTVLVLHSPLRHTVLDDAGPANSVYTSDDAGFSQVHTDALIRVLAAAPQVALVVTGHTHSPLKARGLLTGVVAGDRTVMQFNAMALPFVRRNVGPTVVQDLVTWELGITADSLVLRGRDHRTRLDVAEAIVPLPPSLPRPRPGSTNF